jgi:ribonuclease HI
MEGLKSVEIFTDGACSGNPGPGGYGTILRYNGVEKELSGGDSETTNNRMELMAAIAGLEALNQRCRVTLYSDSKYLVDAVNLGWAEKWRENGWMRTKKDKAQNADLWERLLTLISAHEVDFIWVKGHAGHPENERCDALAVAAGAGAVAEGKQLPPDTGYTPEGDDTLL